MTLNALELGSPQWLFPAAGLAIVALLAVAWSYRRAAVARRDGGGSVHFEDCRDRAVGFVPGWSRWLRGTKPREGANLFAVVVDNSRRPGDC